MLKLQTPVDVLPSRIGVSFDDRIMVIGSCFADNIGQKMAHAGLTVCVNPTGTLYNPVSVCNSIHRMAAGVPFKESETVMMGAGANLYCSFSHHTSFADASADGFLAKANAALEESSAFFGECNKVIITLGTAWCFSHNETGETVANCLKRPSAEFTRYRLGPETVVSLLKRLLEKFPDKQFIFTVSPVRHLKDTAHGNQISKSILLLAVEQVCALFPERAEYFPAYEIMMDELRDYRFYAEDMVHPSDVAVGYLWERFQNFAVSEEDRKLIAENEKIWRQSQHRQMH